MISEGVVIGAGLGAVGAGIVRAKSWKSRIAAGAFGLVASVATTGMVIRWMKWPRETDVELALGFAIAVVAISVAMKVLKTIDQIDLLSRVKSLLGGAKE